MSASKHPGIFTIGNPQFPKLPRMTVDEYAQWVEKEWLAWGKERRIKAAEATWQQRVTAPFKA